ncbi:hypothetical protein V2G26_021206 [Clonostachys chloroleuca]
MARLVCKSDLDSGEVFYCPDARAAGCDKTFITESEAACHSILQHQAYPYHRAGNGNFLCPFRETSKCTTGSFPTQRSVTAHIRKKHKNYEPRVLLNPKAAYLLSVLTVNQ